ncbi:hypothetical protein R2Q26_13010 [Nitrosomonas sp. Is37]|nr:hypothetical protein [Nitrosomonas sp. Is37]MDV6345454.1 hypothetical protein [Nitrosomonas sp. Is37]
MRTAQVCLSIDLHAYYLRQPAFLWFIHSRAYSEKVLLGFSIHNTSLGDCPCKIARRMSLAVSRVSARVLHLLSLIQARLVDHFAYIGIPNFENLIPLPVTEDYHHLNVCQVEVS